MFEDCEAPGGFSTAFWHPNVLNNHPFGDHLDVIGAIWDPWRPCTSEVNFSIREINSCTGEAILCTTEVNSTLGDQVVRAYCEKVVVRFVNLNMSTKKWVHA